MAEFPKNNRLEKFLLKQATEEAEKKARRELEDYLFGISFALDDDIPFEEKEVKGYALLACKDIKKWLSTEEGIYATASMYMEKLQDIKTKCNEFMQKMDELYDFTANRTKARDALLQASAEKAAVEEGKAAEVREARSIKTRYQPGFATASYAAAIVPQDIEDKEENRTVIFNFPPPSPSFTAAQASSIAGTGRRSRPTAFYFGRDAEEEEMLRKRFGPPSPPPQDAPNVIEPVLEQGEDFTNFRGSLRGFRGEGAINLPPSRSLGRGRGRFFRNDPDESDGN